MKMAKAILPLALMMFFAASCGSKPVEFDPNFYEFVTKDGGYITDEKRAEKIYCDQPRIRKEFAALHINKIIELRRILRNAKVPDNFKASKENFLKNFQNVINKAYK